MIGHFPEGEMVTATLARCRGIGLPFADAWTLALHQARRGRQRTNPHWQDAELGLTYARDAFERAYTGSERTRQDQVAKGLLDAMRHMYDMSEDAAMTALMDAA